MSFAPGARIGAYEILSPLGAGGMGEVYRARDTRLNRDVAIKVLLPSVADDPDRMARFQREAQLLGSLNHPHIAAVYGVEDAGATLALILELVVGPTLADRIASGPIPLDEALQIAHQLAEALEAAHEQGIIHRDLKPGNVKVRDDGAVKVLDFGLAKALDSASGSHHHATMSPTLSMHATQAGIILGTAAYMAPEQARGRPVDRRADIWAFGVVVFEMLAGRRAFEGDDISITLASVLKDEVDWSALPAETPAHIRTLLRRCLQKDPQKRLPHIGLARIEIEEGRSGLLHTATPAMPATPAGSQRTVAGWKRAMPPVAAAVIAAALAGVIVWNLRPTPRSQVVRFRTGLPQGVNFIAPARQVLAMSPDGSVIAFGTSSGLFVHTLSDNQVHEVLAGLGAALGTGPVNPLFSEDGRWLAFFQGISGDGVLKKVAVRGGAAITLCRADPPFGATWSDAHILFATATKGIQRISENGGTLETIVPPTAGTLMQGPQMLPGGEAVLFSIAQGGGAGQWDRAQVVAQVLKSGQRKVLIEGGADARYVPTGHIVYGLSGVLLAVPFDVGRLEVHGGSVPIVEGVRRAPITGAVLFGFSTNGTMVFVPGPLLGGATNADLAWTNKDASVTPLKLPPSQYETPRISPDGRLAAVGNTDANGPNIWVVDLTGTHSIRRLTYGGRNRNPVWSPDGRRIAFQSDREGDAGIFAQQADGSGTADRLTRADATAAHVPESWSPDGQELLFTAIKGSEFSLWSLSLADKKTHAFGNVRSTKPVNAAFSPDGRWVAYGTDEGGTDAVYVQPFPPTGAKYQISSGDVGHHALWSRDGKQLFYIPGPTRFSGVTVATLQGFAFSAPVPVPRGFSIGNAQTNPRNHDVAADGRFLGVVPGGQTASTPLPSQLEIVLNWFEELKQRVPVK
jgi:eukaryotic-like serine/threonine-protein kinase